MTFLWDTPPHNHSSKFQIADVTVKGKLCRISVKHSARKRYCIFLDGVRTAYSGKTMKQAKNIAEHVFR